MKIPEDKWFTDGELLLHYLDWGNPGATTMLLVHGLCCESHYWDFFASAMSREYHVIAVDQRGHGESKWMGNYSLEQYEDDLARFVSGLGLTDIVLIGHSMGAIIVMMYTSHHPDRVRRLVVVDNGPELNRTFLDQVKASLSDLPMVFDSEENAARQIAQESPYYSEDYKRHLLKNSMQRDGSGRLIYKFDPALRHGELIPLEWLWPLLEKVVCPILVVHGEKSGMFLSAAAHRMAERLPLVSLIDVERAGHFVMGDNPEAFEMAVRNFLSGIVS